MEFLDRINKKKKRIRNHEDILLHEQNDRRLMPDVPSLDGERKLMDRRGDLSGMLEGGMTFEQISKKRKQGIRYLNIYEVAVTVYNNKGGKKRFRGQSRDVSFGGLGLVVTSEEKESIKEAPKIRLKFHVEPGSLPEGYEMNVNIYAKPVRHVRLADGMWLVGFEFVQDLSDYAKRRKDRYMLTMSSLMLFFISAFIMLMRSESIIYFKFNKWLYLYSIITAFS